MPSRRASVRSRRQISESPVTPTFQVRRRSTDSPETPPARREIFPSPRKVYRRFQDPSTSQKSYYINQPDPGVSWYDDSDSDSSGPPGNIDQPDYDDDEGSDSGPKGNIDQPYPGDIVYAHEGPEDGEGEITTTTITTLTHPSPAVWLEAPKKSTKAASASQVHSHQHKSAKTAPLSSPPG